MPRIRNADEKTGRANRSDRRGWAPVWVARIEQSLTVR